MTFWSVTILKQIPEIIEDIETEEFNVEMLKLFEYIINRAYKFVTLPNDDMLLWSVMEEIIPMISETVSQSPSLRQVVVYSLRDMFLGMILSHFPAFSLAGIAFLVNHFIVCLQSLPSPPKIENNQIFELGALICLCGDYRLQMRLQEMHTLLGLRKVTLPPGRSYSHVQANITEVILDPDRRRLLNEINGYVLRVVSFQCSELVMGTIVIGGPLWVDWNIGSYTVSWACDRGALGLSSGYLEALTLRLHEIQAVNHEGLQLSLHGAPISASSPDACTLLETMPSSLVLSFLEESELLSVIGRFLADRMPLLRQVNPDDEHCRPTTSRTLKHSAAAEAIVDIPGQHLPAMSELHTLPKRRKVENVPRPNTSSSASGAESPQPNVATPPQTPTLFRPWLSSGSSAAARSPQEVEGVPPSIQYEENDVPNVCGIVHAGTIDPINILGSESEHYIPASPRKTPPIEGVVTISHANRDIMSNNSPVTIINKSLTPEIVIMDVDESVNLEADSLLVQPTVDKLFNVYDLLCAETISQITSPGSESVHHVPASPTETPPTEGVAISSAVATNEMVPAAMDPKGNTLNKTKCSNQKQDYLVTDDLVKDPHLNLRRGFHLPMRLISISFRLIDRTSSSTGPEAPTTGVEGWGWSEALNDWSQQEKALLNVGWRKSTLSTYHMAWKSWKEWCAINNMHPNNPSGSQLARFLAYLSVKKGLAPSTIALHKSAVLVLCDPNGNLRISNHPLVKRVMRGIGNSANEKPRAFTWDPGHLVSWLCKNPPKDPTLFKASRRCSVILLLASRRRVHDLTLLHTSPDKLVDNDDHIILWPIFGSKTDSSTYRQSGWKLYKAEDSNIDPIFWLRKLMSLGENRRQEAGVESLFVSTLGPARPASRTVIGGWIKTILKDAGIDTSPGSLRSAVASRSWLEECPIDTILDRGNWRSENTFKKYYRKQISGLNVEVLNPLIHSQSLTKLFQAIQ